MEVNPSNQRQVLGPVLSLIRFPLMTVHEFGEAGAVLPSVYFMFVIF